MMDIFEATFIFIAVFVISNASYLPPGIGVGGYFLDQKLNFLENKFKGSTPTKNADQNDPVEGVAPVPYGLLQQKLWFLQNKFKGPKYAFIKRKIEGKYQVKADAESDNVNEPILKKQVEIKKEMNGNGDFIKRKMEIKQHQAKAGFESPNHQIAKRSANSKAEGDINKNDLTFAALIRKGNTSKDVNSFLADKLSFLENKLKGTRVDFPAVREKIEANERGASEQHKISKRDIFNEVPDNIDALGRIFDGLLGIGNTALKLIVDNLLANVNVATYGILDNGLKGLQTVLYDVIDRVLPSNTATFW